MATWKIAWKIPWTEEPGRLQSMGSQRVEHDWAIEHTHTHTHKKHTSLLERLWVNSWASETPCTHASQAIKLKHMAPMRVHDQGYLSYIKAHVTNGGKPVTYSKPLSLAFNDNHFYSGTEESQILPHNLQVFEFLFWGFYGVVWKNDLETAWQENWVARMTPEVESYLAAHGFLAWLLQGHGDHPSRAWASAQNCWAEPRLHATHSWQEGSWRHQSASILSPPLPAKD